MPSPDAQQNPTALEIGVLAISLLSLVAAFALYVLYSPLPEIKLGFPFIWPTALLLLAILAPIFCIYRKARSRLFVFVSGIWIVLASSLVLFIFDYSVGEINRLWARAFPGNIAFENLKLSIEVSKQIIAIGLAALGGNISATALLSRKPEV